MSTRMTDYSPDFDTLEKMEWAFSKGDVAYISKVLDSRPSIVLRIHGVCMLADMKREESVLVRHESGVALGSIGDERARPGLMAALEDVDEDVRLSAEVALADLEFIKRLRTRTEILPIAETG